MICGGSISIVSRIDYRFSTRHEICEQSSTPARKCEAKRAVPDVEQQVFQRRRAQDGNAGRRGGTQSGPRMEPVQTTASGEKMTDFAGERTDSCRIDPPILPYDVGEAGDAQRIAERRVDDFAVIVGNASRRASRRIDDWCRYAVTFDRIER